MTDPIRWSEAGDLATESERMLVDSGRNMSMPDAEKRAVWNQILGALPPVGAVAPAKTAILGGSGSLLALKVLCVLAAATGLTVGARHWLTKAPRLAASQTPFAVTANVTSSSAASEVATSMPEATSNAATEVLDTATAPSQVTAPSRASQLREESLAVMAARQALRANDASKALHLLEQAQQRFKKGVLAEEREALTIEALAKSGQGARAAARAAAFLQNYPRSPHAADVQQFVAK